MRNRPAAKDRPAIDYQRVSLERIRLLDGAIRYYVARRRRNSPPIESWQATVWLCAMAVRYVCALENRPTDEGLLVLAAQLDAGAIPNVRTYDPTGVELDRHRIAAGRSRLRLAGIAYAESRYGADGHIGFARDALRVLSRAAVRFVALLEGTNKEHLVDEMLDAETIVGVKMDSAV